MNVDLMKLRSALERSYLPCDTTSFIDWLQPFRHLTKLSLICLYLGGGMTDLLSTLVLKCPNLTHLILQDVTAHKLVFDPMTTLQQNHHQLASSLSAAANVNTNLVFLHVSYRWRQCSFQHLIPILSRCPNLKYLSVAGEKDLDGVLFDYCPNLAYIDWMFFATRHKVSWIHHRYHIENRITQPGIQELSLFSFSNDIIDDIIRRQLTRHTWRMSLDDMDNENDTVTRLLPHCPSLRTIQLPSIRSIQLLDMLSQLTQLREIDIRVVGEAAKSCQLARFFSSTYSSSCLQSVQLETDQPLSSDSIIAMAHYLPHLRIVSLRPTQLDEKDLLVLLHMAPLLEKLRVENVQPSLSLSFFRQLITLPHLDSFHAAYTHLSSAGICLLANKMANTSFSLTLSPFTTDDSHCIQYTEQRLKKGRFRYYHQEHC